MTEYSKEKLSALMDDELGINSESVMHTLVNNDDHKRTWSRYHLIGECLRGNLPKHIDLELADRIKEEIKNEPTILAPKHIARTFIKPVMGFAIAASVAVVAILGIQQTSTNPTQSLPTQSFAVNQLIPQNKHIVANAIEQPSIKNVKQLPAVSHIEARSRLNRYLVNYNEYRATAGMQVMLPYVRIVAYETDEQE